MKQALTAAATAALLGGMVSGSPAAHADRFVGQPVHHGPDRRPCVTEREWLRVDVDNQPAPTVASTEHMWEVVGLAYDDDEITGGGGDNAITAGHAYPACGGYRPDEKWYGFTADENGVITTMIAYCKRSDCGHVPAARTR